MFKRHISFVELLLVLSMSCGVLLAQTQPGMLRGRVTDPSGAVIPRASVAAGTSSGQKSSATTDAQGNYEIKGLAPGNYTVTISAQGFAPSSTQNVAILAGQARQFDISLDIEVQKEQVQVEEHGSSVSTAPSENASSLVIKGQDLEALSDDPDELQSELEALAGPSAGPNGGQIYIDGFTGGQLPPKSAIREIRINQNPFSAEYDKLGYGRIEIFTKPGSDQYHGRIFVDGNESALNTENPFLPNVPAYDSTMIEGNFGGPLGNRASFFIDAERRSINDSNIVNAIDPSHIIEAVPNPRTRENVSPRLDFQLGKNNTLTVRYQFFQDNETNQGVGQFSLPSQAYNSGSTEHTVQISDTQVLSTNVVNETRFQYLHDDSSQTVASFAPTIQVLQSFVGGGNQIGNSSDAQNHYELQNYTSVMHGNHFIKFGARLRELTDSNISVAGFNGVFTFPTIQAYLANQPSQFSVISGQPLAQVSQFDAGLYGEDDWRIRPNMTLSYGLRFESQDNIGDHADVAPRLTFAWGLGSSKGTPKTVLRAGFGTFYDRIDSDLVLQTERVNGINQQQTIVENPTFFPSVPANLVGNVISPTIYQFAPGVRAPMIMQSAVSVERQVNRAVTVSATYLNSNGEHQLFLRNANAPYPGTFIFGNPSSGVRPLGNDSNVYQYTSEGVFRQNQLIANFRINAGPKLSLFGYYSLNYANSDLGAGSAGSGGGGMGGFFGGGGGGGGAATPNFISNQYDPMADYGPAAFNVRNRVFLAGTIALPYAFRLNPFILMSSGQPFNIVLGQDVNGDSIFNDRPDFISTASCSTITPVGAALCTPFGTFSPTPVAGGRGTPINYGTGPGQFVVNLRLSKTFGFGPETKGGGGGFGGPGGHGGGGHGGGLGPRGLSGGGGGGSFMSSAGTNRRYSLTFSVSARNLLNRYNFAAPVGNLDSPLFAQSTQLAGAPFSYGSANRRIDLQVAFAF